MSSSPSTPDVQGGPCENTDRELWREREGDYYADSIHVTERGGIGINCGGMVYVRPVRDWHAMAARIGELERELASAKAAFNTIAKEGLKRADEADALRARLDASEIQATTTGSSGRAPEALSVQRDDTPVRGVAPAAGGMDDKRGEFLPIPDNGPYSVLLGEFKRLERELAEAKNVIARYHELCGGEFDAAPPASTTQATNLERRYANALHHIAMNGFAHKDWKFAQLILDGKSVDEAREEALR